MQSWLTPLAWLGAQGTRAIAAIVVVAIAAPPLDALLKPFVTPAIFLLLLLAFIRVDAKLLRLHLRHPSLVIAATAWTSVGIPILCGIAGLKLKLDLSDPQLFLSLMLQSVAPPMMAAPALAALLGLDATLVLITLVTSAALNPLTAPVLTYAFDRFWGEADTEGKNETLSPLAWSATTSGPGKARSANTVSRSS
jgi:predicted Na+-dependent transporter